MLDNKIAELFDKVHTEDRLKAETTNYLYAEIRKRRGAARTSYWRLAAVCASFVLLLCFGGFSYRTYFMPVTYIDMDVNPSIELTLNRLGKVIGYQAYNDDGTKILNTVEVGRIGYKQAVEKLIDAMGAEGYFGRESFLSVTVQTKEDGQKDSMLRSLQETIDAAGKKYQYGITSDVYAVTEEVKDSATAHHVSPAKYLLIQELTGLDANISFEECRSHSVYELRQQVREKCGQNEAYEQYEEYDQYNQYEQYEEYDQFDDPHTHGNSGHHH